MKSSPTALRLAWAFFLLIPSALIGETRPWTNKEGVTIHAEFLKLEGDVVHLKMNGGKIGKVALGLLSEKDQRFVKERLIQEKQKPNDTQPAGDNGEPTPDPDWPNDHGEAPPEDFAEWVYPEGTAIRIEDKYWSPSGNQLWKDATFKANAIEFHHGYALARTSFTKSQKGHGYIGVDGNFLIGGDSGKPLPEGFETLGNFGENKLAPFSKRVGDKALWGYMDHTGKVVLEPQWYFATPFSQGLAAVSVGEVRYNQGRAPTGTYHYIDQKGKVAIEGGWIEASPFSKDGLAAVRLMPEDPARRAKKDWVFVRTDGSLLIPGDFMDRPAVFRDGTAVLPNQIIDTSGKTIFTAPERMWLSDCDDDSGVCILWRSPFGNDTAIQRLVHRKTGRCFGPVFRYARIFPFHEGRAVFEAIGTKKFGFIDRHGKVVVEAKLSTKNPFKNGYFYNPNREEKTVEYWTPKGEIFRTKED
ncbi:WG repeat-containing protein [Haloferula sp.]|uniref:WG repeat-containing protein n=1 Tax=Haloferula sp. TaxID=2497595 RepID=UPI003C739544